MTDGSPTPDELEQSQEADPRAEDRAPDPEHPDIEEPGRDRPDDELPVDADPADLMEQRREVEEWPESDPDERD